MNRPQSLTKVCFQSLFHLRDFSPIFHFYRTFTFSTVSLLWFFIPRCCDYILWFAIFSPCFHCHSTETCNFAVGVGNMKKICLQLSFNCMSDMTKLLISRVIKDWFSVCQWCVCFGDKQRNFDGKIFIFKAFILLLKLSDVTDIPRQINCFDST